MTIDRERLRRLALVARDDDQETSCAAALTPGELELAKALDPTTVLELLARLGSAERTVEIVRIRCENSTQYRDEMLKLLNEAEADLKAHLARLGRMGERR